MHAYQPSSGPGTFYGIFNKNMEEGNQRQGSQCCTVPEVRQAMGTTT